MKRFITFLTIITILTSTFLGTNITAFAENAPLPQASISEVAVPDGAVADAAYLFKTCEEVPSEEYKNYNVDFRVSFDKDVQTGQVILGGIYAGYSWTELVIPNLNAGKGYYLMADAMEAPLTYEEICTVVKEFTCGPRNVSVETCTKMTVALVMRAPGTITDIEIASVDYMIVNHNYVKESQTKATCTAKGYDIFKCTICGDSYKDNETEVSNHKWNAGVITLQPTTTATGTKKYTCTECGATKNEILAKLTQKEATPSSSEANKAKVLRKLTE